MCNQTEYYKDMAEFDREVSRKRYERGARGDYVEVTENDKQVIRANDKLSVYKDDSGEYRWRRVAANGEIIAVSGEGFKNWQYAFDIAQSLWPDMAILVDISGSQHA